jgi:hypothetical protein
MGQQEVVEAFGNKASPVRLLLTSIVASEGINFHFRTCIAHHLPIPATASGNPLKPSSAGLTSKPASLYKLGVIGKSLSGIVRKILLNFSPVFLIPYSLFSPAFPIAFSFAVKTNKKLCLALSIRSPSILNQI